MQLGITYALAHKTGLCYSNLMKKEKASVSVRITKKTHKDLKIFAAKKLTTIDGAIQILLKQGGY